MALGEEPGPRLRAGPGGVPEQIEHGPVRGDQRWQLPALARIQAVPVAERADPRRVGGRVGPRRSAAEQIP